jgi:hypothetical protein
MEAQFGQHLAGVKAKVAHHPTAFLRRGVVGSQAWQGRQGENQTPQDPGKHLDELHVSLLRYVSLYVYHEGCATTEH